MNLKRGISLSLLLIALDQIIKIVIYRYFMDVEMNLLGDIVYFSPIFNEDISWTSAKTGFKFSLEVHIVFSIMAVIAMIILGKKYRHEYEDMKYVVWAYWIALAGAMCSVIDRVFWGTSLDYIGLKGCFVFDLKDVLIDALYVISIGVAVKESKKGKDYLRSE